MWDLFEEKYNKGVKVKHIKTEFIFAKLHTPAKTSFLTVTVLYDVLLLQHLIEIHLMGVM